MMLFNTQDTIVAISTPAGAAARAIVRLSGQRALELAGKVFSSPAGAVQSLGAFRSADGLLRLSGSSTGAVELPARVYVFRAPRSYTRQDVCELHVAGGIPLVTALLDELISLGARQAQPGEFTARAFFSGRIDLSAAEGVADIIHAADDVQLRSGLAALGGRTWRLCKQASEQAADALAAVEASIDLAEEDIEIDSPLAVAGRLRSLADQLAEFARQADDLSDAAGQLRIILAGRPNVGKSCLLNALAEFERAIVSPMAGTTRDVLSAEISLEGTAVTLQDAAGFGVLADPLQQAGENAARSALAAADMIAFVVDATEESHQADLALLAEVRRVNEQAPMMLLMNKADLLAAAQVARRLKRWSDHAGLEGLAISAVTGSGLSELRRGLAEGLKLHATRSGDGLGLHRRQKRELLAASTAAMQASILVAGTSQLSDRAELAAIELRQCLGHLGQISGQVVSEDVLGRIFMRFCVGK